MTKPLVLLSADRIAARVRELASEITRDYAGQVLTLVSVLKGSFVFAADLARAIELPIKVDFLGVRSYGAGTETSGVVQITPGPVAPNRGRERAPGRRHHRHGAHVGAPHGATLLTRGPAASIRVCSLLHKPARARTAVKIDYLGFTIEDRFVVGYGMDAAERYRNLPYIGVIDGS